MSVSCGIVGLPNAGKSTIFNALTSSKALVADYPFTTIDPNIGIVNVPDERLMRLAEIIKPQRVIPSTLKIIDIAGLVEGACKGEGLGNRFLANIREVDAIIHVVRCFESDLPHVYGKVDPKRDIEIVNLELILADLETVERRKNRVEKVAKSGNKEAQVEYRFLDCLQEHLSRGSSARLFNPQGEGERMAFVELNLLTAKSVLYLANLSDTDKNENLVGVLEVISKKEDAELISIFGKLESELSEFTEDEAQGLLKEMGYSESGFKRLIRASYKLLDLITFYTTNGIELRAWSIRRGTKAPKAAGKIHSDIERGFIKAEVMSYDDLLRCGSDTRVKELGFLRIEGKDYEIQDGNMVYFRFKN